MRRKALILALLVVISNLYSVVQGNTDASPRIIFFDIGVGDSALLLDHDFEVFIDGGPDDKVLYKLEKYLGKLRGELDILIITHMHTDHYLGIYELLERYKVGELWIPRICETERYFSVLLSEYPANKPKTRLISSEPEQLLTESGIVISAVSAMIGSSGCFDEKSGEINNSSIILKIESDNRTILMTGDAHSEYERMVLAEYSFFTRGIEILKAGHHCSKTSSSSDFLKAVNPKLVICSTGEKNSYGHPSKEVIDRFENLGIEYLVTFIAGDTVFSL